MKLFGTSFIIQEFVPHETYIEWGERSVWFIDEGVVLFAQWLKDTTNETVTINNWYWNGPRRDSGYRPPIERNDIYAEESSHRRGKAIDVVVSNRTPDEIRNLIVNNFPILHEMFGVTGIETNTNTWTHIDFRTQSTHELYQFSS